MNIKNKKLFFTWFILYIVIMIGFCVVGTIPNGNNTWNRGGKIYFPYKEQVVGNEFDLIGGAYSKDTIDNIEVKITPSDTAIPVEQEKIYYEDEELLTLSTFKASVNLPDDGEYIASIMVNDSTGEYEFDKIAFTVDKSLITSGFVMFSNQHFISLFAVLILYIVILVLYKKYPTEKTKNIIYAFITICIIFCDFAVKIWLIKNGLFKASYDAFLHMCDISGPFLILLFYMKDSTKRQKFFSLMFIWGVLGAAMALLTPEMRGNVFPSMYFLTFFIKHGAIVIGVLIIGVIEGYSPKLKHLPIVMAISLAIVAVIYFINQVIVYIPPFEPGNYMFLSYPPTAGSALDILVQIFGPSPYYIIGMVVLALVLYTFMWAIYAVIDKVKAKK